MLKIWILTVLIITFADLSTSVTLDCQYENIHYNVFGKSYSCKIKNNLQITSPENTLVTGATGNHQGGKIIDDVVALYADTDKNIEYFPKGLKNVFKNLKIIWIQHNKIKGIHQSDLIDLPDLAYLKIEGGMIEILEEGLFKFNPNLTAIYFSRNKIVQIDEHVFDDLTKLSYLHLSANTCVDMGASGDANKVKELIKRAKAKCKNSDYAAILNNIKDLEEEIKNSKNKKDRLEVQKKLQILESNLKGSKFSTSETLNKLLEDLKKLFEAMIDEKPVEECNITACSLESSLNSTLFGLKTELRDFKSSIDEINRYRVKEILEINQELEKIVVHNEKEDEDKEEMKELINQLTEQVNKLAKDMERNKNLIETVEIKILETVDKKIERLREDIIEMIENSESKMGANDMPSNDPQIDLPFDVRSN